MLGHNLGDAIAKLAKGLSVNKTLKSLRLDSNNITLRGINSIDSSFSFASAIEYVSLRNNKISDENALKLSRMFERCLFLQNIRLKDDSIKDWDAVVSEAQRSRQNLKESLNNYKRFILHLSLCNSREGSSINRLSPEMLEGIIYSTASQFGFTVEFVEMIQKNPTFSLSEPSVVEYSDNDSDSE